MGLSIGRRTTLKSSGWKGVRDVPDPYSIPPSMLARARNVYLPEPGTGVGVYARPGFRLKNGSAQINAGGYGQAIAHASTSDGTIYNFFVCGGKLYRASSDFTTYTDVTPAGITIATTGRVHLTPFSNRLVVNDNVNTPWVADVLGGTVTGTKIDYTGDAVAWQAYGPAVVYQDSLFFVVRSRNNGGTPQTRVARIGWSKTDDPFTGYRQTNYDFEWDVIENGTAAIYALWATNLALHYFREESIGYFTGDVGPDLKTTATHDAVDFAIGTRAPAGFAEFANKLFFIDTLGRPQQLTAGQGVSEIWKQLRRVVPNTNSAYPAYTALTVSGALVPDLDLYVVAIYAPNVALGSNQYPTILYAFDAATGRYVGEWTIGASIAVHAIGNVVDANGHTRLAVMGSKVSPPSPQVAGAGGYVWILGTLAEGVWTDGSTADGERVPDIFITTAPLGYDADLELSIDRVVAIVSEQTGDTTPYSITISPSTATVDVGSTQPFTAVVRNAAGAILDIQPDVWTSSDTGKATINSSGLATGVADGTTNITATLTAYGITSNTAVLTVVDPTLPRSLTIAPQTSEVTPSGTLTLVPTFYNAHGTVLPGLSPTGWTSDNATQASVSGSGVVTGASGKPNLVDLPTAFATSPWTHSGTAPVENAAIYASSTPFTRIASANGTVKQTIIPETADDLYVTVIVRSDGTAGTLTGSLVDSVASATRAAWTITIASNGTISCVAGTGTIVRTAQLTDQVYAYTIHATGIVAKNTCDLSIRDGGTATSALVAKAIVTQLTDTVAKVTATYVDAPHGISLTSNDSVPFVHAEVVILTFTTPTTKSVQGTFYVVVVGGGGGGTGGGAGNGGGGGTPMQQSYTVPTLKTATIGVGTGGAAGGTNAGSGTSSQLDVVGFSTFTGQGGTGAGPSFGGISGDGAGTTYTGGSGVGGSNGSGSANGGGGGAGCRENGQSGTIGFPGGVATATSGNGGKGATIFYGGRAIGTFGGGGGGQGNTTGNGVTTQGKGGAGGGGNSGTAGTDGTGGGGGGGAAGGKGGVIIAYIVGQATVT